jgi:low molecular weight protein-tyrosine phosphatase
VNKPTSLLFVCLGNICRSPMAEGIFLDLVTERGLADQFTIDSCGLGAWHVGEKPDPRARATAAKNGIVLPSIARQFDAETDTGGFDLLLAMDASNARGLVDASASHASVRLVRSFDPELSHLVDDAGGPRPGANLNVPDPYYGGDNGFDQVYAMLVRACTGLLDEIT